jgi:hypothetical protein
MEPSDSDSNEEAEDFDLIELSPYSDKRCLLLLLCIMLLSIIGLWPNWFIDSLKFFSKYCSKILVSIQVEKYIVLAIFSAHIIFKTASSFSLMFLQLKNLIAW